MALIGFHIDSTSKTLGDKVRLAEKEGADVFQWFPHSPYQTAFTGPVEISDEDQKFAQESRVLMCTHSPYILNLVGPYKPAVAEIILDDLHVNNMARGIGTVLHPGTNASHHKLTVPAAEATVAANINRLLKDYNRKDPTHDKAMLLIENNASETNKLFNQIDRLAWLHSQIELTEFFGFCLDTQHLFASGYDLRNPEIVKETFREFDQKIGLKNLEVIHLNDSEVPFGVPRDRHRVLGDGYIFGPSHMSPDGTRGSHAALQAIIHIAQSHHIPLICETKKDHAAEIALVRSLQR